MRIEWSLKIKQKTGYVAKKTKWLTERQVLTKKFTRKVFKKARKRKQYSYLNQSINERSPLIHSQNNLIQFVESNKFDKVYSKIWNIFGWSIL